MKPQDEFTYLTIGSFTYKLVDRDNYRPKGEAKPNFYGTGKALVSITVKDSQGQKECHHEAENKPKHKGRYSECKPCHQWGKEDLSNLGTTILI